MEITSDHPVYVEGKGWLWVENLAVGDRLRRSDGGVAKVLAVERVKLAEPEPVYNFTVKGPHTYFVLEVGVLVHNASCELPNRKIVRVDNLSDALDELVNIRQSHIEAGENVLFRGFNMAEPGSPIEMRASAFRQDLSRTVDEIAEDSLRKGTDWNIEVKKLGATHAKSNFQSPFLSTSEYPLTAAMYAWPSNFWSGTGYIDIISVKNMGLI